MRFLGDAQLPPRLAGLLHELGHVAEHVADIGLASASDTRVWRHAKEIGAVIVTKDSDFAFRRRLAGGGPAVVWIRLGNTTSRALAEKLLPMMPEVVSALEAGEMLVEVR